MTSRRPVRSCATAVLLAVGITLSGCGSAATRSAPAPSASPSPAPTAGASVVRTSVEGSCARVEPLTVLIDNSVRHGSTLVLATVKPTGRRKLGLDIQSSYSDYVYTEFTVTVRAVFAGTRALKAGRRLDIWVVGGTIAGNTTSTGSEGAFATELDGGALVDLYEPPGTSDYTELDALPAGPDGIHAVDVGCYRRDMPAAAGVHNPVRFGKSATKTFMYYSDGVGAKRPMKARMVSVAALEKAVRG